MGILCVVPFKCSLIDHGRLWLTISYIDHLRTLLPLCDPTSRGAFFRYGDRDSSLCWHFRWCPHELSRMLRCRYVAHGCRKGSIYDPVYTDLCGWCHCGTGLWSDTCCFGMAMVSFLLRILLLCKIIYRSGSTQSFSSRIFYIQLIIYGALFPLLLFIIKETRGPVIRARLTETDCEFAPPLTLNLSASKAASNKKITNEISKVASVPTGSPPLKSLLYTATVRPFHMLFTEPVIAAFTLWSAFCFGIVYTCIQSISQIYGAYYGFTDAQSGYVFTF